MRFSINHFDLVAHRYDRLFARPDDDPLPRLVDARPASRVLDVGGGTGRNAQALQRTGARVVVCDISLGMLRRASARGLPSVLADVTHLPFAAGVFDRALVVDAYHHFVDPSPNFAQNRANEELLRILKHGGRLVIEELDPKRWQTRAIAAVERLLLMGSRFLSPETLVSCLEAKGARHLRCEHHQFSVDLVFEKASPETKEFEICGLPTPTLPTSTTLESGANLTR
jgi:demethylmenaquinone methyltransferase/2-methoxy-6-polyprenyl-1,4-benzoquinol methylase